jgi:hypothetical protein
MPMPLSEMVRVRLSLSACNVDFKIVPVQADLVVGERNVTKLVDGVGRVGDEFPEKNLLVRVDGVDHQVKSRFDSDLNCFFAMK